MQNKNTRRYKFGIKKKKIPFFRRFYVDLVITYNIPIINYTINIGLIFQTEYFEKPKTSYRCIPMIVHL